MIDSAFIVVMRTEHQDQVSFCQIYFKNMENHRSKCDNKKF